MHSGEIDKRDKLLFVPRETLSDKRRPQFDREAREIDRLEQVNIARFVL